MTTPASPGQSMREPSPSWRHARSLWAGLSIITMWLAVLFVGIFGGDFVSNSASNGSTSFPVVVFLLPFVMPATIAVARRGFTDTCGERRNAPDPDSEAREQPASGPRTLQARPN